MPALLYVNHVYDSPELDAGALKAWKPAGLRTMKWSNNFNVVVDSAGASAAVLPALA